MVFTGGRSLRRFPGHRVTSGHHLHGAERPRSRRALPDVARQSTVHVAAGHHGAVLRSFRHLPVLRSVFFGDVDLRCTRVRQMRDVKNRFDLTFSTGIRHFHVAFLAANLPYLPLIMAILAKERPGLSPLRRSFILYMIRP